MRQSERCQSHFGHHLSQRCPALVEGYDYLPGFLAAGGKTGSWAGSAAGSAGEAATALRINPGGMAAVSTVRSPFCCNLQAVEKCFYVRIAAGHRDCALSGVKELQKRP